MMKSLPFVYKDTVRRLLMSLLLTWFIFGFFGFILGILGLGLLFTIFDLPEPARLTVVLFYIFVVFIVASIIVFRGRLKAIEINDDELVVTRLTGRNDRVARSEITQLFGRKQKIILQTVEKEIAILINHLPSGTRIVLPHLLLNWVPPSALPPQARTNIEAANLFLTQIDPLTECFTAETEPRLLTIKRAIGFSAGFLLAGGALFFIYDRSSGNNVTVWVLVLAALLLLWLWIVWHELSPKTIALDKTGISYSRGKKMSHTFKWVEIDAIEVLPQPKCWRVWTNGRYTTISYSNVNDQNLDRLFDVLSKQALVHDVPIV